MTWLLDGPWLSVLMLTLLLLALFHRPLAWVGKVLARSLVGLGFLALWVVNLTASVTGIALGMNLMNALVIGILGLPGFVLLLLTQWVI